jgi:ribosome-associated protein
MERLGPTIRVVTDDERSQLRNRELALERLRARLAEALRVQPARRPTRAPRSVERKRLEGKRRRADVKRLRRPPPPD